MKHFKRKLGNFFWDYTFKKLWMLVAEEPFNFLRTIAIFILIVAVAGLSFPYFKSSFWFVFSFWGGIVLLLSLSCKITFRGTSENAKIGMLTDELQRSDKAQKELEKKNEQDRETAVGQCKELQLKIDDITAELNNLRKRGLAVYDTERECFLSLCKVHLYEVYPYDYAIENGELVPWDKSREVTAYSYRISGARRIQKEAHVGLDLNKIKIKVNYETKRAEYLLPETEVYYGGKEENEELHHLVLRADTGFFKKLSNKAVMPSEALWQLDEKRNLRDHDIQIRKNADEAFQISPVLGNARNEVEEIIKTKIVEPRLKMLGFKPVQVEGFEDSLDAVAYNDFIQSGYNLIN